MLQNLHPKTSSKYTTHDYTRTRNYVHKSNTPDSISNNKGTLLKIILAKNLSPIRSTHNSQIPPSWFSASYCLRSFSLAHRLLVVLCNGVVYFYDNTATVIDKWFSTEY
jgi:hypothetical protein